MNRSFLARVALATGFVCPLAQAAILSDGAQLRGGSGTDWSSDLGPDYSYPISPDDPVFGPGSTSPQPPSGHYFHGESLDNQSYFGSPSFLGGAVHVDIAASGDVEGKIHHVHLANTIPALFSSSGLGGHSAVNTAFYFEGGTPGSPTTVYYAYDWQIRTDIAPLAPGAYGPSLSYLIDVGSNGTGRIEAGTPPLNLSGSRHGSFQLGNCGGGTSFSGAGCDTSQFSFAAFNPSGSGLPGGTSTYDVWFAFSAAPITSLPIVQGVPEPESWATMAAGLALLGWLGRRRATRAAPAAVPTA